MMSMRRTIALGIVGSVLVVAPTAVALAQPQAAACALINYRGLDRGDQRNPRLERCAH